jgi:hypothetical protein
MSVFVYDYDHNSPNPEHYKKTHKPMFDIIREKNPDLPIVMVTRPNTCQSAEIEERIKIARETYEIAVNNGDKNVYFINGQDILNYSDPDIMTVDGCHPTDFGFWCMAQIIGCDVDDISIKATTTERLGFVGREEGMSAYAVVLIETID